MSKRITKFILHFLLSLFLPGCDPNYFGKTFIKNESSFQLNLHYHTEFKDSMLIIQSNPFIKVYHFGGLGEGRGYDCCSCDFLLVTLKPTDSSKNLIKDTSVNNNWNITNTNRERSSSHEITCKFIVRPTDIQ